MNDCPPLPVDEKTLARHETAGAWFMRRRDARWTDADEAEFQGWLAAAPEHRATYDRISGTWAAMAALPRPALASEAGASAGSRMASRATSRRGFFGAFARHPLLASALMLAGLLLGAGAWYRSEHASAYRLDLATGAGETRHLDLPDGSRIDLNFDSRLTVRFTDGRREAVLLRGEAFFQVAPNPARPFAVDLGPGRVTVVGTRFNLRADAARQVVKVQEGRVQVATDRGRPDAVVALGPSQGLVIGPGPGTPQPITVTADGIGDWRSGRLVFRRATVAEVADEVGRYLGQPVRLEGGARLDALRVSGFADTRAPAAFLEALPDLLPVVVRRAPEGGYVIAAR